MNVLKPIIGVGLIVAAVAGLAYWETTGREAVSTRQVLVAASDIEAGTPVSPDLFVPAAVLKENILSGALTEGEWKSVKGMKTESKLLKGQQISKAHFTREDYAMEEGKSPYRIDADWIAGRSSSLRKGDVADFYDSQAQRRLGTFEIAFVKNSEEQEVVDLVNPGAKKRVLERTGSSGYISHVEIVSTLEEYAVLQSFLMEDPENRFLIVQKENREDG